jgi:hypothetical protein
VHRSSESFAALASALAKAQAQLVNPEKSLIATIRTGRMGENERTFRYAPLSSGLEIVRKTLSEQEIAVIQTTAIDPASRTLNLTTLLAHSSGEWIASHWPVCAIAEIANPHRMGAALTYARRYALFTLVGIAGEDDLDAPDVCMQALPTGSSTGGMPFRSQTVGNGKGRGAAKPASPMVLEADESVALRNRLLGEIEGLSSQDAATSWARDALVAKNKLTTPDAKVLEDAFEQKMASFSSDEGAAPTASGDAASDSVSSYRESSRSGGRNSNDQPQPTGIDKSVLAVNEPRRYRNKEHLRYVTLQPCLLCARRPSDAHHLKFAQPRALGRKASDEFTVPLCRTHHRAAHRAGDERTWWKTMGVDPLKAARKLWKDTRLGNNSVRSAPREIHQTPETFAADRKAP